MSRTRSATVNFVFHCIALGVVLMHGIVLVPLYLAKIPIALYGAWLATGNVLAWIELVDPGLSSVLQQRISFFYGTQDREQLGTVIATGLFLNVPICILPLLALPISGYLPAWVHLHGEEAVLLAQSFRLGLWGTSLSLAAYALIAVNIGLHRSYLQGLIFTVGALTGLSTTLMMLLGGYGLRSLPVGLLVRSAVLCVGNGIPILWWARRYLPRKVVVRRIEANAIVGLLSFSFVGRLGSTLADRADAFLTATVLGPGATAILTLTGRPLEPAKILATRIAISLMPGLAHLSGEGRSERVREVVRDVAKAVGTLTAVMMGGFVALNGVFVPLWAGSSFYGGQSLTLLLGAAGAAYIFSSVLSSVVFALGGVRSTSKFALVEAVLKLGLQFVLLRFLGILGVPLGALIASALLGVWSYPVATARLTGESRSSQLRLWLFNWAWLIGALGLGAVLAFVRGRLGIAWTWPKFIVAAALVGALYLVLGALLSPSFRDLGSRLRARMRRVPAESGAEKAA